MKTHAAILLFAIFWAYADAEACSDPNARDHVCGEMCAPTCSNPHPNPRFCPHIVCHEGLTSGCRCDDGFVKEDNSNELKCVRLGDCPQ